MTKPNSELLATRHLTRQGYVSYYPRYLDDRPGKVVTIRPLFPRYLFIQIDQAWYSLLGTRGISRVLLNDEGPQALPERNITALKAREDANGLYRLLKPPKFYPGDHVKLEDGPLAGHLLIYEGMSAKDKVRCLWDVMGRKATIEVAEKDLIAA